MRAMANYSSGDFSLREAIGLANGNVESLETITFAASLTAGGPKTIHLTRGELRILDSLAINGPGRVCLRSTPAANDPTPNATSQAAMFRTTATAAGCS